MKTADTDQRVWIIVIIILPLGILFMILAGQLAIRLNPHWTYPADMRSYLDPNSAYLIRQGNAPVEPLLASILTPPVWLDVFLTPMATYPTRPYYPPEATYTPTPTSTAILPTSTFTPSPTRTVLYPTLTFTPTVTKTEIIPTHTPTPTATPVKYTLIVNIVGSGTVVKNPTQAAYPAGTGVLLTAIANPGWTFSGWLGDLTGSTNPATIMMDGNKTVTATFTRIEYTLTINIVGSGTVVKNPNQATYPAGTGVLLIATANPGWTFSGWLGDLTGSTNPATIMMDGNKTVTATFTRIEYILTINIVGSGTVVKNPNQATYPAGTSVLLTAIASTGWTFTGWAGDLSGSTNPASITMDGDKTVVATFVPIQYTLSINIVNSGTVLKSPNMATYPYGTDVQLTAIPDPGWLFDSWLGDLTGSTNPGTITINGNKSVTAIFILDSNEPDIGQPDGNLYDLGDGSSLVIDLGTAIEVTGGADPAYDLVYYEYAVTPTEIHLDWIILQISTNGTNWYTIFYWGDYVPDTHSNVGGYPENDNQPIPLSVLYGTLPLKTGIAINVDGAPGVAVPAPLDATTILGPVPPGSYRFLRIYAPPGGDGDGAHVDSIDVLP